jgi:phage replication-related protein YjqB (UPF0714/DUF867 family)
MVANHASIRKTLPSQGDLRDHSEHCSVDPRKLREIGSAVGSQVRIMGSVDDHVLYTVSESVDEDPDGIVRMGQAGRERLGTPDELDGVIDSQVPHPTLSDAEAEEFGEFVERLRDGRSRSIIAIGPHGGNIEPRTDLQAERVASRLVTHRASSWVCRGYKSGGGAGASWHITAEDIDPRSFPRLASVAARGFTHAVAFHGFDESSIIVGGLAAPELKEQIRAAIDDAVADPDIEVRLATPDDPFNGDSPRNIVNRLTANRANGVQIEQGLKARTEHWEAIADAVADVYARWLRRARPAWHERTLTRIRQMRDALRRVIHRT